MPKTPRKPRRFDYAILDHESDADETDPDPGPRDEGEIKGDGA